MKYSVNHSMSCAKGGFVAMRHDSIKNLLTVLLSDVCKDVQEEPHLQPVTTETMDYKSANIEDGARPDIKARGFWQMGQTAFFDVRVTHVNADSQKQQTTESIFKTHEQSKKREYLQPVIDIENGSFPPLIFGTNGGVGNECMIFLSALANKLAKKSNEDYSAVISWLRTRLSFEAVRSAITCVRGSRTPFKGQEQNLSDFHLINLQSEG